VQGPGRHHLKAEEDLGNGLGLGGHGASVSRAASVLPGARPRRVQHNSKKVRARAPPLQGPGKAGTAHGICNVQNGLCWVGAQGVHLQRVTVTRIEEELSKAAVRSVRTRTVTDRDMTMMTS
jgi:hypothetical protein